MSRTEKASVSKGTNAINKSTIANRMLVYEIKKVNESWSLNYEYIHTLLCEDDNCVYLYSSPIKLPIGKRLIFKGTQIKTVTNCTTDNSGELNCFSWLNSS